MKHPGADADQHQAKLTEQNRFGQHECICGKLIVHVLLGSVSHLYVLVGPIQTVNGKHDHHQVADGVPEFGYVVRDLVVGLAPVDCGSSIAPIAAHLSLNI